MDRDLIQADYEKLEQLANQFLAHARARAEFNRTVCQQVDLVRSGWIGRGSDAFMREIDAEIVPAMQRLVVALEEASTVTCKIATTVRAAEVEAAQLFAYDGEVQDGQTVNAKKQDGTIRVVGAEPMQGSERWRKGDGDAEAIDANDIAQGGLGDCYVMASLAAVAKNKPKLISDAIRKNDDGTYTITLHRKSKGFLGIGAKLERVQVVVKPELPIAQRFSKATGEWIATHAYAGAGDKELWPQLMEKGYGQLIARSGDQGAAYASLNRGGSPANVLEAISGATSTTKSPEDYSIKELAEMNGKQYAITLSSLSKDGKKTTDLYKNGILVRNHAYWVESVDARSNTITLRNPWGYSDSPGSKIVVPYREVKDNFCDITVNPLGNK